MAAILNSAVRSVRRASTVGHTARWASNLVPYGIGSQVTAVLGAQWGDEGKGKLADFLAENYYDVVGRFNGGANAGHTVIANGKKFAFHLLPCGIVHPHTKNILGNGTVIHIPSLFEELEPLNKAGIDWKGRLFVSDRAHILLDVHKMVDGANEKKGAEKGEAIGTTKQGIGPAYASKAQRNALRVGMTRNREAFLTRVKKSLDDHVAMYGVELDVKTEVAKADEWATRLQPLIVDGVKFIHDALNNKQRILAEGANAAMLDLDFGTYPYVTSSSTTAGGVCTGLGIPPTKIQALIGVVKAYTTRVGGGPFPTELTDARGGGELPLNAPGTEIGLRLQQIGREIGVTTGRKRRCGWFDAVVAKYANAVNGFTALNLTKLDVLDGLTEVKIAIGYKLDGRKLGDGEFPSTLEDLRRVEVVYESMPGWQQSTCGVKELSALPKEAQQYIKRIEQHVGVPVAFIGTGPSREEMITNGFKL